MSDPHDLLPWFVNGTLEPGEARRFEEHLAGCEACRREIDLVRSLEGDLAAHGADLLGDHPDPDELLAAGDPDQTDRPLEHGRAAEVLRHANLCATCAEELGWLRGEGRAAAPGPGGEDELGTGLSETPSPKGAYGWTAWLGWAAAAAVALLLVLPSPREETRPVTGVIRPEVIRSTERSGEAPTGIAAGSAPVHLLFEVDAGPEAFPLAFEVTGPSGEIVFRTEGLLREDLLGGAAVSFVCSRADCPDGSYHARAIPADSGVPPTEYFFRLVPGSPLE